MKSDVEYSTGSWVLTLIITAAFGAGLIFCYGEPAVFYPILAIAVPMYLACLYCAPVFVSADNKELCIHSSFKIRSILMADVISVERYRPIPGTIRTCASGGFMGYWGKFRDNAIGHYTGFWGNNNDCFLITLTNGKNICPVAKIPTQWLTLSGHN